MIASIALAASLVSFPGGSCSDLADSVGKATGRNVFICQAFVKQVKKFDYETKSYDDLAFDIRMNAKLHLTSSTDMVFDDGLLYPARMAPTEVGKGSPVPAFKDVAQDEVVDGKVTYHTKGGECLDPARLVNTRFAKRLTVHWILAGYAVAVYADKLDEKTFLGDLAACTGGKFVDGKDGYRIDLDPEALRKRALNLLAEKLQIEPPSPDPVVDRKEQTRLIVEILQNVSGKTIQEAFQTPGSKATEALSADSPIVNALIAAYRVQRSPGLYGDRSRVEIRTPAGTAFISPQSDFSVELHANFSAALSFKTIDAQGRPGNLSLTITPSG